MRYWVKTEYIVVKLIQIFTSFLFYTLWMTSSANFHRILIYKQNKIMQPLRKSSDNFLVPLSLSLSRLKDLSFPCYDTFNSILLLFYAPTNLWIEIKTNYLNLELWNINIWCFLNYNKAIIAVNDGKIHAKVHMECYQC